MTSEKILPLERYQQAHHERAPAPLRRPQPPRGELIDLEAELRARTELALQRAQRPAAVGLARSAPEVHVTTWYSAVASTGAFERYVEIDPMAIAQRLLDRLLPSE
jgi:hypothetical protein